MKTIIIFSIAFIAFRFSTAQNLVPNWSFEQYDTCPAPPMNFVVSNWFNPSFFPSTPDYYCACSGYCPNFGLGYQIALTGNAYAGLCPWALNNNGICGEFISCELTDSLINNHDYLVSFNVSLSENSGFAISNLGLYFSDTIISLASGVCFPFSPHIENSASLFLSSDSTWMQISGTYHAHGGEKFITIGNLDSAQNTNFLYLDTTQQQFSFSYYIVDDVTVIDADSVQGINDFEKTDLNIYPNPATNFLTIKTKTRKQFTLKILDLLGKEKMSATFNGDSKVDVGSLAQGVYVYRVYDRDVIIKTGKLLKQ